MFPSQRQPLPVCESVEDEDAVAVLRVCRGPVKQPEQERAERCLRQLHHHGDDRIYGNSL